MSNLTGFTSAVTQPQLGEIIPVSPSQTAQALANGFLPCDGSIVSQAAYPALFAKVGLIKNNFDGTAITTGTTQTINGIAYSGSQYVIVGASGIIYTSPDTVTWTSRSSGTAASINSVTYNSGRFVAVASDGYSLVSTDNGVSWNRYYTGVAQAFVEIAYGNGVYVAVGSGGAIVTSSDGTSWTQRTSSTTATFQGVAFGNNTFIAVGASGVVRRSVDNGVTWTDTGISGVGLTFFSAGFTLNKFIIAVVGTFYVSSDGATWQNKSPYEFIQSYSMTEGAGLTVLGGGFGTSNDNTNFILRGNSNAFTYCGVYANSKFTMAGLSGVARNVTLYSYNTASDFALPYIPDSHDLKYYIKSTS